MNYLNAFDDKKPLGLLRAAILIVCRVRPAHSTITNYRAGAGGAITPPPRGARVCCAVCLVHIPLPLPPWAGSEKRGGARSSPYT